jgi:hypothetical protein
MPQKQFEGRKIWKEMLTFLLNLFCKFFIKDKIIIRKHLNKFQPIIVLHSILQKNIWKQKNLEKNENISPQKKIQNFFIADKIIEEKKY